MSEPKLISPMLDKFAMGGPISDHHGVCCCPAMEENTDNKYIVKVISIPASRTQLDALLLSGAYPDEASAKAYFRELADGVIEEINILDRLSQQEGFVRYENWQMVPMDEEVGYDIYLLGTYKRTLERHFKKQPMTHLGALNLGLDLCAALTVCRRSGFLYTDLKPSNVYVTGDKEYRIGDLGFVRLDSLKYASLPDKYHSKYTAPEITDAYSALNSTIDVYAVGLILYQTYNNGDLPFTGDSAPAEQFPAPAYADYELAEIILKACAPDPAVRWQDPMQMGQALVSYMQRNGANDTPIVPPPVVIEEEIPAADAVSEEAEDLPPEAAETSVPETDAEEAEEQETSSEANGETVEAQSENEQPIYGEDDFGNLTFLLDPSDDETDPASSDVDISYEEVSEEISEILTQADEIASHPVPDPVVPPEPIDIPIPEPLPREVPEEVPAGETDAAAHEETASIELAQAQQPEEPEEDVQAEPTVKKKKYHWLRNTIIVLLILALAAAGIYYYNNYYLLPIESIVLDGSEDTLVVQISSHIDESLLTVVCSDPHGNQIFAPVTNGSATFTNLVPDTAYTVKVVADGFHKLTGDTSKAYSTPMQSSIVQFSAVTGAEDGSVILSFTVDGPDSAQWKVVYSADGEEERTESFPSHMVTITGLTVGKEYTFKVVPDTDLYVTGTDEIKFTASKLVCAENLTVNSCINGELTASWSAPADTNVESWTVRCYNDNGYNETVITAQTTAVFSNLDDTDAFTVEVAAAGMSVTLRVYVAENSVTLSNFQVDLTSTQAAVTWDSSQQIGQTGWLVSYTVNGVALNDTLTCTENSVKLSPVVPGAVYELTVQKADGSAVLGGTFSFTAASADTFSCTYKNYTVTADNMTFRMCKTPSNKNWDRYDLKSSDYTTTFSAGQKASFLVKLDKSYGTSSDTIVTLFVISDSEGNLVSVSSTSSTWTNMWYKYYCELDIPSLPDDPGEYTVSVYFNGQLANTQEFTIVS